MAYQTSQKVTGYVIHVPEEYFHRHVVCVQIKEELWSESSKFHQELDNAYGLH